MIELFHRILNTFPDCSTIDLNILHSILKENHNKIQRRPFSEDLVYSDIKVIVCVFSFLSKSDLILREEISKVGTTRGYPNVDIPTQLYGMFSKELLICPNGYQRPLLKSKDRFSFCGRENVCICNREANKLSSINYQSDLARRQTAQQKRELTMLEKHGVANPMQSIDLKQRNMKAKNKRPETERLQSLEKTKSTTRARYGCDNVFQNEEIKQKSKNTLLEKYGKDNSGKVTDFREKASQTYFKKTGHLHPFKTPQAMKSMLDTYKNNKEEIVEKIKTSHIQSHGDWYARTIEGKKTIKAAVQKAFGTDNPMQSEIVKKRLEQTNFEKYGGHPMRSVEIKKKFQQTNFEKYGGHPNSAHYTENARNILSDKILFTEMMSKTSARRAAEILGVDYTTIFKRCKLYEVDLSQSSTYETEIAAFLTDLGVEFIRNDRTIIAPNELDFIIPSHNLAIEFNGLYYHCDSPRGVDHGYHLKKYQKCADLGLRLVMINEDEWLDRPHLIEEKLKNLLGKGSRGLGARRHKIQQIKTDLAKRFCDKHHIQSGTGSQIAYGSYLDGILTGVICIGKQRTTQRWELKRFCTDGKSYAGLFSKLFKTYLRDHNPNEVITFADLRYSAGNLYEKSGFCKKGIIPPDYCYVKGFKTFNKSSFQKNAIKRKFNIEVSEKTEAELMKELGYYRMWDCGKIKYSWSIQD
jgi:hypothetical protein